MAQLVVFHHAQGLTDGVKAFADQLGSSGHQVTVPDLYDGATFASVEEGVAHAEAIGFDNIVTAALAVAEELPAGIVYAGFSLGALAAHKLAQTRPGARGALLFHHGDVPLSTFGEAWPDGVDVQIHVMADDPFCEMGIVTELIEEAGKHAAAELIVYPGSAHLFADPSLAEYEPEAAEQLMTRTLEFLGTRS